MKTKILFTISLFITAFYISYGQVPKGFNYQAIARDVNGAVIAGQSLPVRIELLASSPTGTPLWQEEHMSVTSNQFGLISLVVGTGSRYGGSATNFSDIKWNAQVVYLKTTIRYPGTTWTSMGTAQIWSVPYAMVADKALSVNPKLSVVSENDLDTASALFEVKRKDGQTVFAVYPHAVNVYVPRSGTKGAKGGFAVGGFDAVKASRQDYFRVTPDSVRIYIDPTPADSKGSKGGFAVGGYGEVKGINNMYLNVTGASTVNTVPGSPQILWYPKKNAFLAGNVHIGAVDSVGDYSTALGYQSIAMGDYSQAFGYRAKAFGDYSTSIGKNSIAGSPTAPNAFALGDQTKATGINSYAFGSLAEATSPYSVAIGYGSKANGDYAHSFGYYSTATGIRSLALGYSSTAVGNYSAAIGRSANAQGIYSLAAGYAATTGSTAYYATALGRSAAANGQYSTAIGFATSTGASANYAAAFGRSAAANGESSIAIGYGATATGISSLAVGTSAAAQADYSYAFGSGASASNTNAYAIGKSAVASGSSSLSFGNASQSTNTNSIAIGNSTISAGVNATSIGYQSQANGELSLALGSYYSHSYNIPIITLGKGDDGDSKGFDDLLPIRPIIPINTFNRTFNRANIANGKYSVAVGNGNLAQDGGLVFGSNSDALKFGALALGTSATANEANSIAIGYNTNAKGIYSAAIGNNLYANSFGEIALGQWNDTLTGTIGSWNENELLLTLGNGLNSANKSNALTIYKNGKTIVRGRYAVSTFNYKTRRIVIPFALKDYVYGIYTNLSRDDASIEYYYSGYFGSSGTSGTYYGLYADYRSGASIDVAEYIYDTQNNTEPADVVVADPANKESVIKSTKPYQNSVVGVISTKPHMTMGMELITDEKTGEPLRDAKPVTRLALTGRVPVKVTNENGPIVPGDVVTTSSTPGHAMKWSLLDVAKAKDFEEMKKIMAENDKRRNAVIGKAVEGFSGSGTGKIMVLISLQ